MPQDTKEVELLMLEAVKSGNLQELSKLVDLHSLRATDSCLLLCNAIKLKHVHLAKFLLERNADAIGCFYQNDEFDIPVHMAVQIGSLELVKILTEQECYRFLINVQNKESQTCLHIATRRGDESIVGLLLDRGAYSWTDNDGIEPLFIACMKGSLNIVKLLLSSKMKNESLELALFLASSQGHEEIVSLLVSHLTSNATGEAAIKNLGETLMGFTKIGPSPLFWACNKGHSGVVKLLLEVAESAEVNSQRPTDNYTPLHLAVEKGHERVVELLLKNGANLNVKANDNLTALLLAAMKKHLFIVELLLSELSTPLSASKSELIKVAQILLEQSTCLDVNDDNTNDLLLVAVKRGFLKTVETLLEYGTYTCERNGSILLHHAVSNGHKEIVRLLLNLGWDVNAEDTSGKAPISYSLDSGKNKGKECVEILQLLLDSGVDIKGTSHLFLTAMNNMYSEICMVFLKNGVDVNVKYPLKGEEALHVAARQGLKEIVSILIEAGVNVNSYDEEKVTPLHLAVAFGHLEIIKILLKNKANVNSARVDGRTPLHIAASRGTGKIIQVLIEAGADINACDEENSTPLHGILHHSSLEMVMTFLKKKANLHSCKKDGTIPLHIAARTGNLDIISALIEAGADINSVDHKNYTPLHFGAVSLSSKILEKFLESGANINAQTISKETVVHLCVRTHTNNLYIENLLETFFNNYFDINLQDNSGCTVLDLIMSENRIGCRELRHEIRGKYMLKYLIKLKAAGFYVNDSLLQAYQSLSKIIIWKLDYVQQNCENEIKRLKSHKISHDLSLFDILMRKQNPTYAWNGTVIQSLASFNHKMFPIYGERLKSNIENCKSRIELLSAGQTSLAVLVKVKNLSSEKKCPVPPAEILESIIVYLNDHEIKSLIICAESVKDRLIPINSSAFVEV